MPRVCRVLLGLPSSGKKYTAENRNWNEFYGESKTTKIANNDYDYDFPLYWEQGYNLVLIWNPAWIRDQENFNAMINSATSAGFSVEKEYFANDVTTASCNAYTKHARKGDTKYYEFIDRWIRDTSEPYDSILYKLSAGFEGPAIATTELVILAKDGCKGGGGDVIEHPDLVDEGDLIAPKPGCLFARC